MVRNLFLIVGLTLFRHGAAHYEVYSQGTNQLVAAGTLVVSDELADRYFSCSYTTLMLRLVGVLRKESIN